MDKKEFKDFCKKEFYKRNFIKVKNGYYLEGRDVICGIFLQKSDYSESYYINYVYFIKPFVSTKYPSYYDTDVMGGRIEVLTKNEVDGDGKQYITAKIRYQDYTPSELVPYFESCFYEQILPPISNGKEYILQNLGTKYFLTVRQDEVLRKLKM